MEVALKMAFRVFLTASGLLDRDHPPLHGQGPALHVLALMSSYHGDTLGSMDCAAPSVFNGILEAPWYALGWWGWWAQWPLVQLRHTARQRQCMLS